jgi:hypothetical protein
MFSVFRFFSFPEGFGGVTGLVALAPGTFGLESNFYPCAFACHVEGEGELVHEELRLVKT